MRKKNISAVLKELRDASGMIQADFANEFDVRSNYISDWENGRGNPGAEKIARMIAFARGRGWESIACDLEEFIDPWFRMAFTTTAGAHRVELNFSAEEYGKLKAIAKEKGISVVRNLVRDWIDRELSGQPLERKLTPEEREMVNFTLAILHQDSGLEPEELALRQLLLTMQARRTRKSEDK